MFKKILLCGFTALLLCLTGCAVKKRLQEQQEHELNMQTKVLELAQAEFENYRNMRSLRNQLAIQSLYEQQYRAVVDTIINEISRNVAKDYCELQMSPKAREALKRSQPAQNLLQQRTMFGMLKDDYPVVVSCGVEYARRLGINVTQQDGKMYLSSEQWRTPKELTPELENQMNIEVQNEIAEVAVSIRRMQERYQKFVLRAIGIDTNDLIARGASFNEATEITKQIIKRYSISDRLYYGACRTGLWILEDGVAAEELPEWNDRLDFLRKQSDINVAQDEKGNIYINGKTAEKYLKQQLSQNLIYMAMEQRKVAYSEYLKKSMIQNTALTQPEELPSAPEPTLDNLDDSLPFFNTPNTDNNYLSTRNESYTSTDFQSTFQTERKSDFLWKSLTESDYDEPEQSLFRPYRRSSFQWNTTAADSDFGTGITTSFRPNAYGLGVGSDQFGRPFRWQVINEPNADTSLLQVKPNAYGLGVGSDQFGRPVRAVTWP